MTPPKNIRFELLEGGSYERFLVRGEREVRFVLRQLASRRANVSAYPDASGEFALLAVLEVAENGPHISLDISPDEAANTALLNASRVICVTQLDRVKIQFALGKLESAMIGSAQVFRARIPDALLRLQRREYYRLVAPVAHPVRCTIPVPGLNGSVHHYEARVLDISGGGVAVVAPPPGVSFTPGMQYEKCTINLPESLPITTTLRVCNMFSVTQRNGAELLRAGCEFVGLTPAQENAVQRYILKVERDRASRVAQ